MPPNKIAKQLNKFAFSTEISNLKEKHWSEWQFSNSMQIKIKWNWHAKDDLIIQIHKKQALKNKGNPSLNYVYYTYLHKSDTISKKAYDYALHEIKITSLLPDERRKLINQVTSETGINPNKNEKTADNYLLRKTLPNLLLINDLGIELTESDFYKVKDVSTILNDEQNEGLEYFGIVPEALLKANKYFAPYTYFFDSLDKKYLLEAVRLVNSNSDGLPEKIKNKPYSFKEKLFFMADMICDTDKAYRYKNPTSKKNDKPHKIKRFFSETTESLYEKGMYYFDTKQYLASIVYFNKTIKHDAFYAPAWHQKGVAYFYLHRWDDALIALNRVIDINPFKTDAYYYRGLIFGALRKFSLSCDDLKQAILLNDKISAFYSSLAMMYTNMGDFKEAINNLNKTISIPETDNLRLQRAKVYYNFIEKKIESREYEVAYILLNKVDEFYQNNMVSLKLKVVIQLRSGKKFKKTFRQIRELLHANNNYELFNLRNNNYKNTKMYANYKHKLWEWKTFFENNAYV